MSKYHLSHLEELEAESIYIMREVAAQFERPVLLFSGGKDSITLVSLAEKALTKDKPLRKQDVFLVETNFKLLLY